jgi:hypothetical protein
VQAGPDAVYCHRRCADLELIDRLAVIRASVSAAAVLDALPDPRRAPTVDTGCTNSRPGECRRTEGMCAAATSLGEHLRCLLVKRGGLRHHDLAMRPHQRVSVLTGRDRSRTNHRPRGRPPDDPIGPGHRTPPAVIANSVVKAMSIMYVRCESDLGHICTSLTSGYPSGILSSKQNRTSRSWGVKSLPDTRRPLSRASTSNSRR